jgi:hypothetical protein
MDTITTGQAVLWLVILLPIIAIAVVILTRKGCTAEINVIWYMFSLVFVIWWSLNAAIVFLGIDFPPLILNGPADLPTRETEPWTKQYFYEMARHYLTDIEAELGFVAAILIIAIVPQFLTYVLAGLSGCASAPKLIWEFETIAIWSLIKFLAAFGGFFTAVAVDVRSYYMESFHLLRNVRMSRSLLK